MPHAQKTTATIKEDGTLHGETAGETLLNWLADAFNLFSGGRAEIVVRRPTRTLRQNRKYWAMLGEIAESFRRAGIDQWHIMGPGGEMVRLPVNKDTLHGWFKRKYLTADEPGETPTTTTLDQTEMSDYMEQVRRDEDVRKLDIVFQDEDRLAHERPA
ncbi:hypothetical protein GGP94_003201 [Salinibacter ruber]|uniref:recombination protein NinB n=1 Tax=Salinibacter ruber TaxID=146919 RepID=UPI002169B10C|nr:recombination protein NinB [Salinibacter ruber]MCS4162753.1 hypothetical protein [Salinibacter ruber]